MNVGRSGASVLRSEGLYLKIAPRGSLERAAAMQRYFARKGFARAPLAFEQSEERDYLLTESMPGKAGIEWLEQPRWLAARLGEAVRALHETEAWDCPIDDVNQQALTLFCQHTGREFEAGAILRKDALVHGDCCLPNVFLDATGVVGFIDLGEGGLGDRHFDLFWSLWSLKYNLKTERYGERFLDAYGRDALDRERLDCCTRLSGTGG